MIAIFLKDCVLTENDSIIYNSNLSRVEIELETFARGQESNKSMYKIL